MANRITHTQAKDYVRLYFDDIEGAGNRPQIIGTAPTADLGLIGEGIEGLDVLFLLPASEYQYMFTVWIEADGRIYGEW